MLAGSCDRKRRAMLPGPSTAHPGRSAPVDGVVEGVAVCADMRFLFVRWAVRSLRRYPPPSARTRSS
ncbi:hypothetical protein GCM10017712_02240 [Curtobacterium citreum]